MKRLVAILLALSVMLSLCACDGGGKKKPSESPSTSSDLTWEEIEKLAEKAEG